MQYEQVARNKILILAAEKRRNAEQFRHSDFDSLCCICHQTPGKRGLSGLVAVHAYPCIGAKESLMLACDILDTQKKCNTVAFLILKWVSNACQRVQFFFLKLFILFKVWGCLLLCINIGKEQRSLSSLRYTNFP